MICLFANSPHNRSNKLTWHEGLILQDEIWVKIGGDKGGVSFKVAFQVANLPCPNSTQHTVIFFLFEAPDTYPNVHTALAIYKEEVATLLQPSQRRYSDHTFNTFKWTCNNKLYKFHFRVSHSYMRRKHMSNSVRVASSIRPRNELSANFILSHFSGYKLRIFMFGGYALLSIIYRISEASGKYHKYP